LLTSAGSEEAPALLSAWWRLLRPRQWIKNALLLAALVYSGGLGQAVLTLQALYGCVLFCVLSSAVYIINDIRDVDQDRQAPVKRERPIAAGHIGVAQAAVAAVVLTVAALSAATLWRPFFGLIACGYFVLTSCYTLVLRRHAVWDVTALAAGFGLRAVAGATAIGLRPSSWLIACTLLLATFLSLSKRRSEAVLLGDKAELLRPTLRFYRPERVDRLLPWVAVLVVGAYTLYTVVGAGRPGLITTVPLVGYVIVRHLKLTLHGTAAAQPERVLLSDRHMLLTTAAWLVSCVLILYVL
jgi:4-hydroxybenzoate polyprenyltransferase